MLCDPNMNQQVHATNLYAESPEDTKREKISQLISLMEDSTMCN